MGLQRKESFVRWSGLTVEWQTLLNFAFTGGADAAEIREFNLVEKKFVNKDNGGFFVNECKSRVYWRDYDTLFVGTNVGEDPLTDSGYPRTVLYMETKYTIGRIKIGI